MTNILWPVVFAVVGVVLVAWFVLTHIYFRSIAQLVSSTLLGRGTSKALAEAVAKKIIYGVAVVFLFTYGYVWRTIVVDAQGRQFAVREQTQGDVHLKGAVERLSLGGFRGVTTCYLWNVAMDQQKKNELSDLENTVRLLTELQPHFNTPWLFQSWNLAYNVSNKTDQPSDKFFWISRGVQLLADGERQNNNNPDLRFEMGATYQHKICQSDETNYHRSLFQLSMIPPNERDPARFPLKGARREIGLDELAKFCDAHPQLTRRLREGIHKDALLEQRRLFSCATPEDMVRFLADNYRVPSLYPEGTPTPAGADWVANPDTGLDPDNLARFPILPPTRTYPAGSPLHLFLPDDDLTERDLITEESPRGNLDSWDGYKVAGAWYGYAQEPLPPPDRKYAGENEPVVDPIHQHVSPHMLTVIFRHYPARAQSYIAERLEEEGWFDDVGWSTKGPEWFAEVIGAGHSWAENAWGEAYKMWKAHGMRNHLLMSAADEENMKEEGLIYTKKKKLTPEMGVPPFEDDPQLKEGWEAMRQVFLYESNRQVTNYGHNYNRAFVEQDARTVRARELFYQAQALAQTGSTVLALRKYQEPDPPTPSDEPNKPPRPSVLGGLSALDAWVKVLQDNDEFRRDAFIADQACEIEMDYLDVLNRALPGNEMKVQLGAASLVGGVGWPNLVGAAEAVRPTLFPPMALTRGPFDRTEADGTRPWISDGVRRGVLERRRLYQPRRKDVEPPTPLKPPQPGTEPIGQPAAQFSPPGRP
jgi:hypothetical protein